MPTNMYTVLIAPMFIFPGWPFPKPSALITKSGETSASGGSISSSAKTKPDCYSHEILKRIAPINPTQPILCACLI